VLVDDAECPDALAVKAAHLGYECYTLGIANNLHTRYFAGLAARLFLREDVHTGTSHGH
jgi:hypothetical protein